MSDLPAAPELPLIPGRECGECNVCCVSLTIDDAEMQKPQGYRCRNTLPDKRCAIYPTRPRTCREFFCGWRQLKWIRQTMRPDVSGVLVRQHGEISKTDGTPRIGVIFTLLTNAALKAEGLAESVAAAVAADIPVYLSIPGPPGYTSSSARINEVLLHAVQTSDKEEVLRILRAARAKGRAGKHVPIVMKKHPPAQA